MPPLLALLGRTNVGKSTLFNRMLRQNKSLTHDRPGVTRDRIYGEFKIQGRPFAVVDTGGIDPAGKGYPEQDVFAQAREAMQEADLILLVVDAKAGLNPVDEQLLAFIRRSQKAVHLVVNKVDGPEQEEQYLFEFLSLGLEMSPVSAAHGYGYFSLLEKIAVLLPPPAAESAETRPKRIGLELALLGRPNVGKSSLINTLLGEKRLIVSPEAGTTRDSVDVDLVKDGRRYRFLDTAGIRRKTRISDSLEHFSILRALRTSKRAQVSVLVLDALQSLSFQDKKLLTHLDREKTPLIIAVNKIDLISRADLPKLKNYFEHELRFCSHVPRIYTSSVTRAGLGGLLPLAERLWAECKQRVGTGELNRILKAVTAKHQPAVVKGRRAKFYYLTQAKTTPPTFVFFLNDRSLVQDNYLKYLEKQIRKNFGFSMAPIQLVLRTSQG
ncbi:MAG: ribosome biogenesis GTPase Der [Thermodesulfobacteriota bacterium]